MGFIFIRDIDIDNRYLLTSNGAARYKVKEVFPLEPFRFIVLDLTCNELHEA